jgi:hypothetical protein
MSPRSPKSERRRKSRKSPPSLVYVELGTENGGMLKDLSEEGFALRTMMPVRAGYKTAFSIVLNASVKIEGQGEVLWIEENGRVAGIRFVEISSEALPQIQGWLNGSLENLETKSEPISPESAPTEAKSFEELRQELHIPSAGAETQPPEEAPKVLPVQEEAAPVEPLPALEEPPPVQEALPPESREPLAEASEETESPASEPVTESASATEKFPGLPDFSSTLQAIEITFDAIPPAPASVPESFPRQRPWKQVTPLPEPEEETRAAAALPEISKILMQPPGVEREFAMNSSVATPMDTQAGDQAQPQAKWTESFTLPRAITLMSLLVLFVGFAVFHRALGNGLIWLGEALAGGAQQSGQSVAPIPADDSSSSQSSSAQETSSAPPVSSAGSVQGSAATSASQRQATPTPVPAVTRSVKSAPGPLNGNGPTSASVASGSQQETGLPEYSKALQLLHGHKGGADTSEAVRLLWDAVGKGNTSAELTLADLYWHGEGIEHNCAQTRNLLTIAAGKGNADAKKQLEKFQQEGCQ